MKNRLHYIKQLSYRIRVKRLNLNLSQEKLAELIDCNVNHIGRIERGQSNPTYIMLIKIARALQISPKDLMPD